MTKFKVIQLGILLAILGLSTYKLFPFLGLSEITINSISNLVLITIIILWVSSYLFRVVNGKMTFMEQRKRYRKEYEKKFTEKIEKKFETLPINEQRKLLEDLEEK